MDGRLLLLLCALVVLLLAAALILLWQNRRLSRQKHGLEHTAALIESAPYYIAYDDEAASDLYANQAAYKLIGQKPGSPLVKEDTHDEKGMRLLRDVAFPAVEKHGAWEGENQLRHSDGHMIDVQQFVFPVLDKHGRRLGLGTLMRDITEEKKLRHSLDIQYALLNSSNDFIVALDSGLNIIYANPAAYTMSGYTKEEIGLDFTPEMFHSPATSKLVRDGWQQAIQGHPVEIESEFIRWDGTRMEVTHKIFAIRNEKGDMLGVGSILNDITELKKTQAALVEARDAAESSSRAKSVFLSNMSHEIRTPMNAIIGMTQIAMHTDDPEKMRDSLQKVRTSSEHLLGIINDILDLSKIESGKLELYNDDFSIATCIGDVAGIIAVKVEEKHQRLDVAVAPDIPPVLHGDANRLAQVVMNLLSNAVKFTGEGGHISLSAEKLAEGDGQVRLRVAVRDEGIGMSEEQQEKLFLPFEQTGASISAKYGGTGLGLAISKRLVEMMGGEISVDSAPGRGSLFAFTVQFAVADGAAAESGAGEADTAQHTDFSGCRILVAEDLEINREVLAGLLEPTHVAIDMAADGAEAVAMFEKDPQRYSLIFMDLQMPVMDGYDATKAIRSSGLPRAGEIPIIAMTANAFAEDVKNSLDAGMDGHISKPLDADDVVRQMLHYIKPAN